MLGAILPAGPRFGFAGHAPAGGGAPLVFASDWRAATGTSDTARRDGGKWDSYNGFGTNVVDVVPATGKGFPAGMSNVLRADYPPGGASDVRITNKWAVPANEGDFVAHRIYFRSEIADGYGPQSGNSPHQLQPAPGDVPWSWKFGELDNGELSLRVAIAGIGTFDAPNLEKFRTVRPEWRLVRAATAGLYRFEIRGVYDDAMSTTVPILTEADFLLDGLDPMDEVLPEVAISDTLIRSMFVGNNDPQGWNLAAGNYHYFGGYAASTAGWCGAYNPAEAA